MTNEGIKIVTSRIEKKINFESKYSTYNRSRIFKRAYYILRNSTLTFSDALKQSWSESKKVVSETRIELSKLKDQLMDIFTPKQYTQTSEFSNQSFYNVMNSKN